MRGFDEVVSGIDGPILRRFGESSRKLEGSSTSELIEAAPPLSFSGLIEPAVNGA